MSQAIVFACDRCGQTAPEGVARSKWVELGISRAMLNPTFQSVGGHVCDACLPALADFLARAPREEVGQFATHETERDISCDQRVGRGMMVQITERARCASFKPTQFVILDLARDWLVHGITIGNREQFAQAGDVPGDLFAEDAKVGPIEFETMQVAMDFGVRVSYVGTDPDGGLFRAKLVGLEPGFAPEPRPSSAPQRAELAGGAPQ